jgi:aminoglycoside phosphotransferase (APT) family kinase protein
MLDDFEAQVVRAALAELGGGVAPAVKDDPAAGAKLQMASMLLSHLLALREAPSAYRDTPHEVATLQQAEKDEQSALAAAASRAAANPVTAASVTPWLRDKLQLPDLVVTGLVASLGGFSKETYLLTLAGAECYGNRLVLRRDQAGGPVEVASADEFAVLKVAFDHGVPVPEPLLADRAPPFGATVMAMRLVPGVTAFDASGTKIGPLGRDASLAMARVLAKVHATPVEPLGLPRATTGAHVTAMLAKYHDQWRRRHLKESPTLAAAFRWLSQNIPNADAAPRLVHGDSSLRNLLLQDGRESALLDWELWHLGDPIEDLAYCRTDVDQVLPWDQFMAEYRAHGGCEYDETSGAYYRLFGAVRNTVFAESLLYDFSKAERPEAKFAVGALVLGRRLVYAMAAALGAS